MIVSASRRTDIPAFYSDWFINRIKQGYVLVRNPMNIHQVSRINLSRSVVDCIVFWTKNPIRMMDKLHFLSGYSYYFQFTLTPYDQQLEPNLPQKSELISTFKSLSQYLDKNRVIWRYDPIILTDRYTVAYHMEAFESLAAALSPYTRRCVISFLDLYKKNKKNLFGIRLLDITTDQILMISSYMSNLANKYDIEIVSCAEDINLEKYGIPHGKCIDDKLIAEISGFSLNIEKDKTQRPECGCVASIDIGAYNTCPHGCLYCYANFDSNMVKRNLSMHDPDSPLLFGNISSEDRVSERKVLSCRVLQERFL